METIINKDEWERYELFKHYDMVHHGFIDGFQLNKAIKLIEEEINNFKGDE